MIEELLLESEKVSLYVQNQLEIQKKQTYYSAHVWKGII